MAKKKYSEAAHVEIISTLMLELSKMEADSVEFEKIPSEDIQAIVNGVRKLGDGYHRAANNIQKVIDKYELEEEHRESDKPTG